MSGPRCINAIFVLLILINLIPIWWFSYFPSQDGPAHVANAKILLEYNRPDRPFLRQYYILNHLPEPNLAGHWIMAGLMTIFPPLSKKG